MGGFVSDDGKKMLSREDIENLVRNKEIVYPIVSREEILDRSKGDVVTKALVVSQTTWFLLQCVARGSQRLALSELELATAAFALVNIIIYALWWDKPLDVHCPIRVRRRGGRDRQRNSRAVGQDQNPEGTASADGRGAVQRNSWSRLLGGLQGTWYAIWNVIVSLGSMMEGDDDTFFVIGETDKRISNSSRLAGTFVTMIFGGVHCIAWSFHFTSHIEQLLWRISSVVITGIPLAVSCLLIIFDKLDADYLTIIVFLLSTFYPVSRLVLLVLSLTTLRSLPPSAFRTVQWTTFFPHV